MTYVVHNVHWDPGRTGRWRGYFLHNYLRFLKSLHVALAQAKWPVKSFRNTYSRFAPQSMAWVWQCRCGALHQSAPDPFVFELPEASPTGAANIVFEDIGTDDALVCRCLHMVVVFREGCTRPHQIEQLQSMLATRDISPDLLYTFRPILETPQRLNPLMRAVPRGTRLLSKTVFVSSHVLQLEQETRVMQPLPCYAPSVNMPWLEVSRRWALFVRARTASAVPARRFVPFMPEAAEALARYLED